MAFSLPGFAKARKMSKNFFAVSIPVLEERLLKKARTNGFYLRVVLVFNVE